MRPSVAGRGPARRPCGHLSNEKPSWRSSPGMRAGLGAAGIAGPEVLEGGLLGEAIGALVGVVAGVAAYERRPHPRVPGELADHALPELPVCDRLLGSGAPAAPLPALEPALGDGVRKVCRVGDQLDICALRSGRQPLEGGHQLHAVVGRWRLAAGGARARVRSPSTRIAAHPPRASAVPLPEQAPSVMRVIGDESAGGGHGSRDYRARRGRAGAASC